MERDKLIEFLNQYLDAEKTRDFGPNGLQVIGRAEVQRVALAVSASLEVFERAVAEGADLIIVHHGLFWEGESRVVGKLMRARLQLLLANDLTLLAYHHPLDRHPTVGNNYQIISRLGLNLVEPERPLVDVGYVAEAPDPIPAEEFCERVLQLFGTQGFVEMAGRQEVRRVGVVSGGAGRVANIIEAAERGCDLYLTGSATEGVPAAARELGIALIAAGHYNTEKLGIMSLGDLVRRRFGLSTVFIDVPNPL